LGHFGCPQPTCSYCWKLGGLFASVVVHWPYWGSCQNDLVSLSQKTNSCVEPSPRYSLDLRARLAALREAPENNGGTKPYIVNVSGLEYRFAAPVSAAKTSASGAAWVPDVLNGMQDGNLDLPARLSDGRPGICGSKDLRPAGRAQSRFSGRSGRHRKKLLWPWTSITNSLSASSKR
jgi:hypothetical protein